MYNTGPYPAHAGYYHGYATNEYPANGYPAHEPHGGPTLVYAPTIQQQPHLQLPSNCFCAAKPSIDQLTEAKQSEEEPWAANACYA